MTNLLALTDNIGYRKKYSAAARFLGSLESIAVGEKQLVTDIKKRLASKALGKKTIFG